ncbi:bifunctional 2-polyprenyl-6-hydroxyphenol methylase/3-demethylubiquinol 3-O-methyltransferase UbiG [Telmatospirillum sp. J64-1]|uniref:class I SAM-dependent methyltransferase n=1 Tax=Telmatospirillum sp. J64-1 TaxID=2502183 RepID=UPI00163D946E|nr:class I SAM-dependent methyltransferase [Telmatospirillum sp. J64-1]
MTADKNKGAEGQHEDASATDRITHYKKYIQHYQAHCDRWLPRLADVKGKRILVLGSGWGTEVLWCLRNGALDVVGVDPADRPTQPLDAAIEELPEPVAGTFKLIRGNIIDLRGGQDFDVILSNNVVEHIDSLKATFFSFRRFLKPDGRVSIFSDPLYYSSAGSHLPLSAWEHLYKEEDEFPAEITGRQRSEFRHMLNRLTFMEYLSVFRESGFILEDLFIIPDRHLRHFTSVWPRIQRKAFPLDLCLEGFGCRLAYPSAY